MHGTDEPEPEPPPRPMLEEGARVGDYRIVRRIGTDGLATSYEAVREGTDDRVVIAIVDPALLSPASLERFSRKVEALRALRHPGIARVLETGTCVVEGDGERQEVAWIARESVEDALPIFEYAREHALGRWGRLTLLLRACEAVRHGHQKGVTHLYLAPGNLLVARGGQVQVVDFGVAAALDADLVCAARCAEDGDLVGTLPYLSPEQLEGAPEEVDTRADVYALGVVAYELLAGCLPIEVSGQTAGRNRRRVADGPARPSRRDPELGGSVEAILMKVLAARPEDRYGSADALAADLRRALEDEPVDAHVPSVTYGLRLFARRHPTLVGGAIAVLLGLASLAVVGYQAARRAERAERDASERARQAVQERERARMVLEQLLERSTQRTTELAPLVGRLDGGSELAGPMMRRTFEDLQLVERASPDDPRTRVALASAWIRFGEAAGSPDAPSLGDGPAAEQAFAHALDLVTPLLEQDPGFVPARWIAVRALGARGALQSARGAHAEALASLDRALALAEALHRDLPVELAFEAGLAEIHARLAEAHEAAGEPEQAAEQLEASRAGFAHLVERAPEVPLYRFHHALGFERAARASWASGDAEAAREAYAQAAYLLEPLVERHGRDRRHLRHLAACVLGAGHAELALGRPDVARRRTLRALGFYRALQEAEPGDRTLAPQIDEALWSLGALEQECALAADAGTADRRGHLEAALGWYEEGAAVLEQRIEDGDADPQTAMRLDAANQRLEAVRALFVQELDGGG